MRGFCSRRSIERSPRAATLLRHLRGDRVRRRVRAPGAHPAHAGRRHRDERAVAPAAPAPASPRVLQGRGRALRAAARRRRLAALSPPDPAGAVRALRDRRSGSTRPKSKRRSNGSTRRRPRWRPHLCRVVPRPTRRPVSSTSSSLVQQPPAPLRRPDAAAGGGDQDQDPAQAPERGVDLGQRARDLERGARLVARGEDPDVHAVDALVAGTPGARPAPRRARRRPPASGRSGRSRSRRPPGRRPAPPRSARRTACGGRRAHEDPLQGLAHGGLVVDHQQAHGASIGEEAEGVLRISAGYDPDACRVDQGGAAPSSGPAPWCWPRARSS